MDASQVFSLANVFVLPGWFLLIFLPRFRMGRDVIAGTIMPLLLGLLYMGIFLAKFGGGAEGGGFGSLEAVSILFQSEWSLLTGWIHYLAFDLFIGAWQVRDSQRVRIPHLLVIPCLLMTFMLGPAGLAVYLVVRGVWKKRWSANETAAGALDTVTAS